jgi:exodeoxyribonuclease-5
LERTRLLQLLTEWFKTQEAVRASFEVVSLEQKQSIEHGGIIMSVMLDRIDKVGDDLVVVDYKTGVSNSVNSWADNRISNPQLPLYVLTNEDIKGATFAQVARNQCKFKGVTSELDMLPKVKTSVIKSRNGQATERELGSWHDWRLHWKESLDAVASEVRQGLATVSPMKSACTHCELTSFCRIGDEQLESNAEEQSEQEVVVSGSNVNTNAGGL